jgi:hypothetical protein
METASSTPKPSRADWHGVRCSSLDDMRTQNIRFWQQAGGVQIRQAAWELVVETWKAQQRDLNELRFSRLAPAVCEA